MNVPLGGRNRDRATNDYFWSRVFRSSNLTITRVLVNSRKFSETICSRPVGMKVVSKLHFRSPRLIRHIAA